MTKKLKKIIQDDLFRLGEKANLRTYEIPKRIHLHHQLFSPANGLLTVTLKTRRANARREFQSIIQHRIRGRLHRIRIFKNSPYGASLPIRANKSKKLSEIQ